MNDRTDLRVPAAASFVSLVEAFVRDAARRSELEAAQAENVAIAARLSFETILDRAEIDGRRPVRLATSVGPTHLHVSLFERGLPIDDAFAIGDARFRSVATLVDEAHWRVRGGSGSELRLSVKRPHRLKPGDLETPAATAVAAAPEQAYAIRRFEPDDAPGVARLFYGTYGYHYIFPAVYVPKRLIALNASERYVSIVAVAQNGEIVGHCALARDDNEPIADCCGAVVAAAHRGRDLLRLLLEASEREAARMNLEAYCAEPVTDHLRTQRDALATGMKPCGVTLAEYPRSFVPTHMELSTTTQRQSCIFSLRPLKARARRTLYPPAHHRDIVERIYAELGIPIDAGTEEAPKQRRGALHVTISQPNRTATIAIERIGPETADLVAQSLAELRDHHRLGAIYAMLPLEDAAAPALCEAAESLGFFFSGVAPWMLGGRDALRLQLSLVPLDLGSLTIVGELATDLLAYVESERRRIANAQLAQA